MTNLADLRAKAEAATPGPWETRDGIGMRVVGPVKPNGKRDILVMTHVAPPKERIADAAYIAAANPQTILRLLDLLTPEALGERDVLRALLIEISGAAEYALNVGQGTIALNEAVKRVRAYLRSPAALAERQAPR
jgi:hypothetical protein